VAWAILGFGYVAAVVFVASALSGSVGDVLLILAAGVRLSSYVGATVSEIGFLRGTWMDGSRRLVWLERYAASFTEHNDVAVPDQLSDGIRLEHVRFAIQGRIDWYSTTSTCTCRPVPWWPWWGRTEPASRPWSS
jgi:ATP-binding cassette subfamily B protein